RDTDDVSLSGDRLASMDPEEMGDFDPDVLRDQWSAQRCYQGGQRTHRAERQIARGFRKFDHHGLRALLIAEWLDALRRHSTSKRPKVRGYFRRRCTAS